MPHENQKETFHQWSGGVADGILSMAEAAHENSLHQALERPSPQSE